MVSCCGPGDPLSSAIDAECALLNGVSVPANPRAIPDIAAFPRRNRDNVRYPPAPWAAQAVSVDMSVGESAELMLSATPFRTPGGGQPHRAGSERRRRRRAAERVCVLARHQLCVRGIAAALGLSAQAVSRMWGRVPLARTPMSGRERAQYLAALCCVPVDDGLNETYWYSPDPVVAQVRDAIELADGLGVRALAGGEVAADALRPWRMPTRGLVYAAEPIDLSVLHLVEATADEATLTVRVPVDATVWATAAWWHRVTDGQHGGITTVDPVVVLQDLTWGPGLDDGARARLINWIAGR